MTPLAARPRAAFGRAAFGRAAFDFHKCAPLFAIAECISAGPLRLPTAMWSQVWLWLGLTTAAAEAAFFVQPPNEYARQLNRLFPSSRQNVAGAQLANVPAVDLAEQVEGPRYNESQLLNWTAERVEAIALRWEVEDALCPCVFPRECTGAVGSLRTCETAHLEGNNVCFDGASTSCSALVAGGIAAAAGAAVAALQATTLHARAVEYLGSRLFVW